MQKVNTLASIPVIRVVPTLPPIEIPVFTAAEPSIFFGDKVKIKLFNVTRQWFLDVVCAIYSVKDSDAHEELMLNLSTLNESSFIFQQKT